MVTLSKKMLMIVNPTAGKGQIKRVLCDVIQLFTKHDFLVSIHVTQNSEDIQLQVVKQAAKFDYLVCSGGDGTLNEIVRALMSLKHHAVLGYIPSGTTNDFATTLQIPKNAVHAAKNIIEGSEKYIDLGKFNQEWFTYVAAFGAFTEVAYSTPQDVKNNFGRIAYFMEGIKSIPNITTYHLKVNIDSEKIEGDFIYGHVSNSTSIGGFSLGRDKVVLDDGYFEMLLIYRPNNPLDLQAIIAALMMQDFSNSWFVFRQVKKVTFECEQNVTWTLDGEFGGNHQVSTIENIPKALNIIVKKEA